MSWYELRVEGISKFSWKKRLTYNFTIWIIAEVAQPGMSLDIRSGLTGGDFYACLRVNWEFYSNFNLNFKCYRWRVPVVCRGASCFKPYRFSLITLWLSNLFSYLPFYNSRSNEDRAEVDRAQWTEIYLKRSATQHDDDVTNKPSLLKGWVKVFSTVQTRHH